MESGIFYESILPEANRMLKKAKLADSPAVRENQKNIFFKELKSKRYVRNEKDEILVLDELGNVTETKHGLPMSGKACVEETFDRLFERNGMPETEAQYMEQLRRPNITPAERIAITNHWLSRDE